MKKVCISIILFLVGVCSFAASAAVNFANETLRYVITYKWGLIHKDAGDATVTLRRNGDHYDLKLIGTSKPWADRIYRVRDTLTSRVRVSDLRPTHYLKKMHERNRHDIDEIKFTSNGNSTTGVATLHRNKKGVPSVREKTFTANGPVFDFLSMFYYLRKLNYKELNQYKSYAFTVFSGSKKETVKIKSMGEEKIKLRNGTQREAYHIRFNFTQDGGKKSSDDIDAWISTDSSHVPLYLVGRLPVGEIRIYLQNA